MTALQVLQELVTGIRKRKGLKEELPPLSDYEDRLYRRQGGAFFWEKAARGKGRILLSGDRAVWSVGVHTRCGAARAMKRCS